MARVPALQTGAADQAKGGCIMVRFTFKPFCVNNLEQELGEDHGKIQTKAGRTGSTAVSVYELTSLSLRKLLHRLGAIQLVPGHLTAPSRPSV